MLNSIFLVVIAVIVLLVLLLAILINRGRKSARQITSDSRHMADLPDASRGTQSEAPGSSDAAMLAAGAMYMAMDESDDPAESEIADDGFDGADNGGADPDVGGDM